MTRPTNAKGKKFSWSFSAVNGFETCPFQYAHRRFYCTVPFIETEPIIWGNRVHQAAELFLKRTPPNDPEAFAPVEKYVTAMLRSGYKVHAELEIALTQDFKPVRWFSKEAWLRAKIDVTLLTHKHEEARLYDWKTGKNIKDDADQLRLCGAALSVVYPEIEKFEGMYVWTAHQAVTGIKSFTKDEVPAIWEDYLSRVARMENAWREERFPPKPSGLCRKWCPVKECSFCGG